MQLNVEVSKGRSQVTGHNNFHNLRRTRFGIYAQKESMKMNTLISYKKHLALDFATFYGPSSY